MFQLGKTENRTHASCSHEKMCRNTIETKLMQGARENLKDIDIQAMMIHLLLKTTNFR